MHKVFDLLLHAFDGLCRPQCITSLLLIVHVLLLELDFKFTDGLLVLGCFGLKLLDQHFCILKVSLE